MQAGAVARPQAAQRLLSVAVLLFQMQSHMQYTLIRFMCAALCCSRLFDACSAEGAHDTGGNRGALPGVEQDRGESALPDTTLPEGITGWGLPGQQP